MLSKFIICCLYGTTAMHAVSANQQQYRSQADLIRTLVCMQWSVKSICSCTFKQPSSSITIWSFANSHITLILHFSRWAHTSIWTFNDYNTKCCKHEADTTDQRQQTEALFICHPKPHGSHLFREAMHVYSGLSGVHVKKRGGGAFNFPLVFICFFSH